MKISHDDFIAFVHTLAGQELTTRAQHQPFTVRVTDSGLEYVPGSTGKPRQQPFAKMDEILDEFAASGSLQPVHYQQETRNSSYQLTLIAMYLEQRGFAPDPGLIT